MTIADRCSSTDSRIKCAGRHDATIRGEFLFCFQAKGWVWRAFTDDYEMVFSFCPWCKAPLPDLAAVYDRLRKGIAEDAE